jgi:hypothetical protein
MQWVKNEAAGLIYPTIRTAGCGSIKHNEKPGKENKHQDGKKSFPARSFRRRFNSSSFFAGRRGFYFANNFFLFP